MVVVMLLLWCLMLNFRPAKWTDPTSGFLRSFLFRLKPKHMGAGGHNRGYYWIHVGINHWAPANLHKIHKIPQVKAKTSKLSITFITCTKSPKHSGVLWKQKSQHEHSAISGGTAVGSSSKAVTTCSDDELSDELDEEMEDEDAERDADNCPLVCPVCGAPPPPPPPPQVPPPSPAQVLPQVLQCVSWSPVHSCSTRLAKSSSVHATLQHVGQAQYGE